MPAVGNFKLIQPRGGPGIFTLTVPVNGHYVTGEESALVWLVHLWLVEAGPGAARTSRPAAAQPLLPGTSSREQPPVAQPNTASDLTPA